MTATAPRIAAGVVAIVALGLAQGTWTGRWRARDDAVEAAVARLDRIAMTLGDWRGTAMTLDPRQVEEARIAGYALRRYEHRRASVTVLLVCGRPGPVSLHTPDVCFAGSGYETAGPPARYRAPAGPSAASAEFRAATFSKRTSAVPSHLRAFWSWSAGGPWTAPDVPRLAFGSDPALFKLYVVRDLIGPDERIDDDPSLELIGLLLPELERALSSRR